MIVSREVQETIIGVAARWLAMDAGSTDIAYFPYTERAPAHRLALRPAGHNSTSSWEVELGRLLPVPAPGTPTTDVLAFRERYGDERARLVRAVHRLLGDLRRDYEHPADVFAQLRRELEEAVNDYRSAAKSVRIAWVTRSLTVTVRLASAATAALVLPDLGWLLGTAGAYTINVATREIRPMRQVLEQHDFSYLHRIRTMLT